MPEPRVTVILPARNEEANIAEAVESLAAQTVPLEIVVVNDGSTDRTGAILAELKQRFPQLRVLDNSEPPPGWTGKNYAIARGVGLAHAPWLLLTDADVRHRPHVVASALALAGQTSAALVSFSPDQALTTWWERAVIPFVYCRLAAQYPYKRVSDPNDTVAAANGQWLLISRSAYDTVGGNAAVKSEILEDVALARRVKESGSRVHFARGVGLVRTRMYRTFREMCQGWSKNLFPLFGCRKVTVGLALGGATLDLLAWLLFLAALGGLEVSWLSGQWLLVAALATLAWRHLQYAHALVRNHYALRCLPYYTVARVLFAALLVNSAARYLSGAPLEWKGRDTPVPIN